MLDQVLLLWCLVHAWLHNAHCCQLLFQYVVQWGHLLLLLLLP
jgi:hypothetical protein